MQAIIPRISTLHIVQTQKTHSFIENWYIAKQIKLLYFKLNKTLPPFKTIVFDWLILFTLSACLKWRNKCWRKAFGRKRKKRKCVHPEKHSRMYKVYRPLSITNGSFYLTYSLWNPSFKITHFVCGLFIFHFKCDYQWKRK